MPNNLRKKKKVKPLFESLVHFLVYEKQLQRAMEITELLQDMGENFYENMALKLTKEEKQKVQEVLEIYENRTTEAWRTINGKYQNKTLYAEQS